MLKKRIGKMIKGVFMAGALSLSACAGSVSGANADTALAAAGSGANTDVGLLQFTQPVKGDELIVLHTNLGDVKLRLYPEEAPKAVENFTTHAKNGYYDGVIFHRVLQDFMIQGGDPDGTGMGGESIWGEGFGYEKSDKLRHFRGALAMAHSQQPDSNGSQFYIVQNGKLDDGTVEEFTQLRDDQDTVLGQDPAGGKDIYVRDLLPADVIDKYLEVGGTPHLDLALNPDGHTVFGQVVEGMDVVDAIAAVKVDGNGKPLNDVVIESVSFETVE